MQKVSPYLISSFLCTLSQRYLLRLAVLFFPNIIKGSKSTATRFGHLCYSTKKSKKKKKYVFRRYQKRSVAQNGLKASQDYQMRYYGNFKISEHIYLLRSYENREVLPNLKTDSDKNLPRTISEGIQPLTKQFGTFLFGILVSFHFK